RSARPVGRGGYGGPEPGRLGDVPRDNTRGAECAFKSDAGRGGLHRCRFRRSAIAPVEQSALTAATGGGEGLPCRTYGGPFGTAMRDHVFTAIEGRRRSAQRRQAPVPASSMRRGPAAAR